MDINELKCWCDKFEKLATIKCFCDKINNCDSCPLSSKYIAWCYYGGDDLDVPQTEINKDYDTLCKHIKGFENSRYKLRSYVEEYKLQKFLKI